MQGLRFLGWITAAALVAGCTDAVSPEAAIPAPSARSANAVGGSSGPSASGYTNLDVGDGLQTFSFHARTNKQGTSGTFEVYSRGQELRLHGDVSCLNVVGNEAVIVGTVTNSKMPEGLEGLELIWAVRDNGEGAGATDEWTDLDLADDVLELFEAADCTEVAPGDVLDGFQAYYGGVLPLNEAGNVQVKP